MLSWEFLRKSSELAGRVLANQRTCTRALLTQSEGPDPLPVAASLSRSSFGGSNNGDHKSGDALLKFLLRSVASSLSTSSFGGSNNGDHKSGDALLKFLLRSVASGVVIVGSSLSFSNWYPSLVDKCSLICFFRRQCRCQVMIFFHTRRRKGSSVIFFFTYNFGF
ncbi:hypothetical protein BDE02_18G100600 [Populus trichocarpa]|nr:hypothetical protein BDE02_18G100600 [Populus trichocarpa]